MENPKIAWNWETSESLRNEWPIVYDNSRSRIWKPKPDITAYELALCLPLLIGAGVLDELPECAARHFERV